MQKWYMRTQRPNEAVQSIGEKGRSSMTGKFDMIVATMSGKIQNESNLRIGILLGEVMAPAK